MRTIVSVFPSRGAADAVARELNSIGIPLDEVAIAEGSVSADHEKEWSRRNIAAAAGSGFGWFLAGLIPQVAERSREGAAAFGAAFGGAGGCLAGILFAAIQSSTIGNPVSYVFAAFAGFCIGAAFGGCAAALYNLGVSHERVALCREAEADHGVVVAAHVVQDREEDAMRVMTGHGGQKTRVDADAWLASGWTGAHPPDEPYPSDSAYRSHGE
jgi:hypothetical protein